MRAAAHTEGKEAGAQLDDLLITGSSVLNRTLVEGVRLADGVTMWWYDRRLRISDLVTQDGMVFVISCDFARPGRMGLTELVALRADDGKPLWRMERERLRRRMVWMRLGWGLRALRRTSRPLSAWNAIREFEFAGLPGYTNAVAAGELVFVSAGSAVYAFSAHSGELRWCFPIVSNSDRWLVAAHGNTVYIRGTHGPLDALDAQTGKVRWRGEGNFHLERLTPSDTLVYVSSESNSGRAILALRVVDGRREQTLALADGEKPACVTSDGIAYLMGQTRLRAVRVADDTELWQSAPLRDAPDNEPAYFVCSVDVAADERTVFYGYESLRSPVHCAVVGGLDATTGARLWEWHGQEQPIPVAVRPRLKVAGGTVYVIVPAGIFAFRGRDGTLLWRAPGGAGIQRAEVCAGSGGRA